MAKQPDPNRDPGAPGLTIDTPTGDVPVEPARLRKVPATVDADGLRVIMRAVLLKQATLGNLTGNDPADTGNALVIICHQWMLAESARLSGKGDV